MNGVTTAAACNRKTGYNAPRNSFARNRARAAWRSARSVQTSGKRPESCPAASTSASACGSQLPASGQTSRGSLAGLQPGGQFFPAPQNSGPDACDTAPGNVTPARVSEASCEYQEARARGRHGAKKAAGHAVGESFARPDRRRFQGPHRYDRAKGGGGRAPAGITSPGRPASSRNRRRRMRVGRRRRRCRRGRRPRGSPTRRRWRRCAQRGAWRVSRAACAGCRRRRAQGRPGTFERKPGPLDGFLQREFHRQREERGDGVLKGEDGMGCDDERLGPLECEERDRLAGFAKEHTAPAIHGGEQPGRVVLAGRAWRSARRASRGPDRKRRARRRHGRAAGRSPSRRAGPAPPGRNRPRQDRGAGRPTGNRRVRAEEGGRRGIFWRTRERSGWCGVS